MTSETGNGLVRAYTELELGAAILDCLAFTLAYGREIAPQEIRLDTSNFALVAAEVSDLVRRAMKRIDDMERMNPPVREAPC